MNYFTNYCIAFSILMGCSAPVCGVDSSGSDYSDYPYLQPITHMHLDARMHMVMMLVDNDVISNQKFALRELKLKPRCANNPERSASLYLNELLDACGISLCEHTNKDDRLRVLYVKKKEKGEEKEEKKVVAACITGCDEDLFGSADSDIPNKQCDENQCIADKIQLIRQERGNIPIQVCRPWESGSDGLLSMLPLMGQDQKLYFLNKGNNKTVLNQGGTVLFANPSKDVSTNAKYIFMGQPMDNCKLTCLKKKASIVLNADCDGGNKEGGCLSLCDHVDSVRAMRINGDNAKVKMEGKMGVFNMKGKSMALVQRAKATSETFHIDQGGRAVVINSHLGDIHARNGGIALVIDSHLGGIHPRNGGRVVEVELKKDAHDGNYAQQILSKLEDDECEHPGIVDLVRSMLDSFKDDIKWPVLGKRQRLSYDDSEFGPTEEKYTKH